jgi:hypothetical protein
VNRRSYLSGTGAAIAAGLLAGCSSDAGSEDGSTDTSETTYGTLATLVTDQPTDIDDFESCVVTLQGIWIKPAGDEGTATLETETSAGSMNTTATENSTATETMNSTATEMDEEEMEEDETDGEDGNGRRYIEFEEEQTADLVDLQGANSQLLEETEVETGEYEFLQLDVSGVEGTLTDGSEAEVDTPGNAPLKFNAAFEIRAEERTQFVADFTPVQRGNGSYLIRPVASGTTVLYGDAEYTEADASTATDGGENMTDGDNETAGGSGNQTGN